MALVQTPGEIGQMLRVTDSLGGCISYAYNNVGTDFRFRGPKFSVTFRFKLINAGGTGRCASGMADVNGSLRPWWLEVEATAGNLIVRGKINSDACGSVTVFTHTASKDTNEHSVAWTYDTASSYVGYYDGVSVASGSSPCSDISTPQAASDAFVLYGSLTPGTEIFYVDECGFVNDVIGAAQVVTIDSVGVTS